MAAGPEAAAVWLALGAVPGLGPAVARRLVALLGGPERLFGAPPDALAAAGASRKSAAALRALGAPSPESRAHADGLAALDARLVPCTAPEYPPPLALVADAPLFLLVRGAPLPDGPTMAIVGARNASPYGRDVAEELAAALALAGVAIVSGLARGIDAAAHRGALRADGPTVAVLGCGIDRVYPPEHAALATEMLAAGALVSELPPGAAPLAAHFPQRNRIIAGMSHGTLVVEAAERSGSLITARLALDYGREVFAVPGRIDSPLSAGTHALLRDGATLTARAEDVLDELAGVLRARAGSTPGARTAAGEVDPLLGLLAAGPLSMDRLIAESGRPAGEVMAAVLELELAGRLVQLPGNRCQRTT